MLLHQIGKEVKIEQHPFLGKLTNHRMQVLQYTTQAKINYITENRSPVSQPTSSEAKSLKNGQCTHLIQSLLKMKENLSGLDFDTFVFQAPQELSKNIENNLSLRMKYPTETEKFYATEEFIHEILNMIDQKLEETEQPPQEILKVLINSKMLVPILKSLDHPNPDINIAAINVLHSLLIDMSQEIEQAENAEGEKEKGVEQAFPLFFRMCVWLTENGLVQGMFAILNRLDEEKIEEYAACSKILKCFEHLIELCESSYAVFVKETKIITFIINRILPNFTVSHRVIDDNKFVASDVLLALLQTPEVEPGVSAVRQLFHCCGVEALIATISTYETKLPTEIDEREFLSNLFDCLNVLVVSIRQSRPQVHQMRGSYLLVTYICNKTEFAVTALKIIANSLDNEFDQEFLCGICDQVVNDGSLKYLFPILKAQGIKGKDEDEQQEINENILNVLYFLVRNSEGVARDRIVYKFVEKRFQKLQRIFQLRIENSVDNQNTKQVDVSPEQYLRMIKEDNLVLIQLCDKIIITLWASSNKIRQKIIVFLGLYAIAPKNISIVIERLYKFIDEGQQKNYLEKMISTTIREIVELKEPKGDHNE